MESMPKIADKTSLLPRVLGQGELQSINQMLRQNRLPPFSEDPTTLDPEYWRERWQPHDDGSDPIFNSNTKRLNYDFVAAVSIATAQNLSELRHFIEQASTPPEGSATQLLDEFRKFEIEHQHSIAMC
jgi:hypothetical protein